jgi:hypothetical protein
MTLYEVYNAKDRLVETFYGDPWKAEKLATLVGGYIVTRRA